MTEILIVLLGLTVGIVSGTIGIGGGALLVPALVYLFGFGQKMAQGTTMALFCIPIGILAASVYYKQGYVDIKTALFICLGFVIGSFVGAKLGVGLPIGVLRKIFGLVLLLLGMKMLTGK